MDLLFIFRALKKNRWIILGSALLAILAATIFTLLKKKAYESVAQYSTGFTVQQVSLINQEYNVFETDTKFSNVLETFTSPKVIGILSYDLLLHDLENPDESFVKLDSRQINSDVYKAVNQAKAKQILKNKIGSLELLSSFNPDEKALIEYLKLYGYDYQKIKETIYVSRVPRTDYISIVYSSPNAYLSAYVVNKIGQEFIRFYNYLNTKHSTETVETISGIVKQKKKQVDSILENLRREKAAQGALNPVDLSKSAMDMVKELTTKISDEKSNYNKVYYELQAVNRQLNALGSTSTNSNADIVSLKKQIRELSLQKDDPAVGQQLRSLQLELSSKQGASPGSTGVASTEVMRKDLINKKFDLEEQLKASDQNVNFLNGEIRKYSRLTNNGAGSDVKIDALKSDVDIATREYSDVKSKYTEAESYSETPTINFKQTLFGQPALEPEPAHLMLTMGISGLSMLALSSLIFILMELFDSSIKAPSHFKDMTGLRLLNVVNKVHNPSTNYIQSAFASNNDVHKLTKEDALFKSAIRKLRFEIQQTGKKVFLFTSTRAGQGKSLIIEALASSLSSIHKRVLIIDTNFAHNSITRQFDVKGMLESFTAKNSTPVLDDFQSIITRSPMPFVDIIGNKGGTYSPAEALGKNNVLENMPVLLRHYDYILMEGAAMNDFSDTKELSLYAEGIISVFGADCGVNQLDKSSIEFFNQSSEKYTGSVLNKVEPDNIDL